MCLSFITVQGLVLHAPLRQQLRVRESIHARHDGLRDCIITTCCGPCAIIQETKQSHWTRFTDFAAFGSAPGSERAVLAIVAGPSISVSGHDADGNSPLHWAIRCRMSGLSVDLICRGADVARKNSEGESPLDHALRMDLPDVVALLAARGCRSANLPPSYLEPPKPKYSNMAWALIAEGMHPFSQCRNRDRGGRGSSPAVTLCVAVETNNSHIAVAWVGPPPSVDSEVDEMKDDATAPSRSAVAACLLLDFRGTKIDDSASVVIEKEASVELLNQISGALVGDGGSAGNKRAVQELVRMKARLGITRVVPSAALAFAVQRGLTDLALALQGLAVKSPSSPPPGDLGFPSSASGRSGSGAGANVQTGESLASSSYTPIIIIPPPSAQSILPPSVPSSSTTSKAQSKPHSRAAFIAVPDVEDAID